MREMATTIVYPRSAINVTSSLNDFKGDVMEWKTAVYELFRYQMTFSFAYKIDVVESRSSGVFVSLIIKPAYKKSVLDTMESLGFCNVKATDNYIGVIDPCDLPDDMLIDYVDINW